jgi:hypothetical protein
LQESFSLNIDFPSHAAHHLLAIYALGASAPVIDAAYQTHVAIQQPAVASPGLITVKNFNDFLGQEEWVSNHTHLRIIPTSVL